MYFSSSESNVKEAIQLETFEETYDWGALFLKNYCQNVFTGPIIVIETLLQVQFQPSNTSTEDEFLSVDSANASPLVLPRFSGDLSDTARTIIRSQEGIYAFFKGHITHFSFKSLFFMIQPSLEEFANEALDVFEDVCFRL